MIGYLLAGTALVSALLGALGMGQWQDWRAAKAEAAQAEADAKVAQLQAEATKAADNSLRDALGAYQAGKEEGRVVYKTVIQRGKDHVASGGVFADPSCVLPPNVLHELNAARAGRLDLAAATGGNTGTVPGAGTVAGRDDRVPVSADAARPATMGGVSPQGQNNSGNAGGQGAATGRLRPKPKAIE